MSTTLDLACHDCKAVMWIGQRDYVYTAEDDTMKAMGAFLVAHMGHRLEFNTEHHFDPDCGWRRVDRDDEEL